MNDLGHDLAPLTPADAHNQRLAELVRAPGRVNPQPPGRYDLVVIGAGTAGLVTAAGAAGLGARVALVERELLGGDCLNVGCVPSKALIACARAAADVRRASELGVRLPGAADEVSVDFPAVMERMRRLRAEIAVNDSVERFTQLGVDVFMGQARFTAARTIEVDAGAGGGSRRLEFKKACLATGARPAAPPIPGLAEAGYLTNTTVFSLERLPSRLGVIGGGPIGCELAQAFARFGARVTLLEAGPRLLGNDDPEAAERVAASLAASGVQVRTRVRLQSVARRGEARVLAIEDLDLQGQPLAAGELEVDALLVAAGRAPNVEGLGLEQVGIAFDPRRGVEVNDRLRTTNRHVYAAGDVASRYKFTHMADAQARIVIRNALFFGRSRASALTVPWCTYTDPELAQVGLTEAEAEARGLDAATFRVDLADVDRARLEGEEGLLKVVAERRSGKLLGATLVARHAGDMISEAALALQLGARMGDLSSTIHPYPTTAEAFRKAGDAWQRTRLTPWTRRVLERIVAWRR